MPGYLLDSNHVHGLFCRKSCILERMTREPEAQLRTSAISLGEIAAGHAMTDKACTNRIKRDEYITWVNQTFLPNVCIVSAATRQHYAAIIGGLWRDYPPPKGNQKTERHLVLDLGVDINDVWIAATALEHGLVLVTRDGMDKVRQTVEKLGLEIQNWMD